MNSIMYKIFNWYIFLIYINIIFFFIKKCLFIITYLIMTIYVFNELLLFENICLIFTKSYTLSSMTFINKDKYYDDKINSYSLFITSKSILILSTVPK